MSVLSKKHFHSEKAAYKYVEAKLWPDDPVCPHCGVIDRASALKSRPGTKGKSKLRDGVYKCYECRKPFTVKVNTIFHDSRIPLHKWLQAIALMASSKKGISASQLSRILEISVSSAWHMAHRLREVMKDGDTFPLGMGGVVEVDEVYYGRKKEAATKTTSGREFTGSKKGRGVANKLTVVSVMERGGKVRSFHIDRADKATVAKIVMENVSKEATMYTDESRLYKGADAHVKAHESVHHAKGEYVRGDVSTNSVEGYFSIFKRGMFGVFQHCQEKNLHRYVQEFDFKFNTRQALGYNDKDRADIMLQGVVGKRLTYRRAAEHAEKEAA